MEENKNKDSRISRISSVNQSSFLNTKSFGTQIKKRSILRPNDRSFNSLLESQKKVTIQENSVSSDEESEFIKTKPKVHSAQIRSSQDKRNIWVNKPNKRFSSFFDSKHQKTKILSPNRKSLIFHNRFNLQSPKNEDKNSSMLSISRNSGRNGVFSILIKYIN